jgi:hypothetical protein
MFKLLLNGLNPFMVCGYQLDLWLDQKEELIEHIQKNLHTYVPVCI